MFENILHQDRIVSALSREIREKTLPPSLLFYGPATSAKLTTALETARALSCHADASWNCPCDSCRSHRTLDYSYLMIMGYKNFIPEIEAAADLLTRHGGEPRRFMLIRALKKLLKRFDPVLWEGEEAKLKTVLASLSVLQEELEAFYPPLPLPFGKSLEDGLKKILEGARALDRFLPAAGIPIHMVRRVSFWARTTAPDRPKFVIMENADRMQDGARNSLLKILEEPPAGVYFILLTSQKGGIIPTVLSRVRPFALSERTKVQEKDILAKLFLDTSGEYENLSDFFQAFENQKEGVFRELARDFLSGLESPVYPLENYGKFWNEAENLRHFLEEMIQLLRGLLVGKAETGLRTLSLDFLERFYPLARETLHRRESFNISASLLVETLFYQARGLR